MSKAAFVRTFSKDTPAATIVAAGKKKGIKLSPAYIYVIRSKDRERKKGKKANGRSKDFIDNLAAPIDPQPVHDLVHAVVSNDELEFRAIVRRKGTEWALDLLGGQP